jgi:AraC family transcriptional regulator
MKLDTGQYTGNFTTCKNINGFIISRSQHCALEEVALHYHINPYFVYVQSGAYDEYYRKEKIRLQVGDILFHPAGREHSNIISATSVNCLNLEMSEHWFAHLQLRTENCSFPEQSSVYRKIIRSICEELTHPDAYSEAVLYSYAIQLTAASARIEHDRSYKRKYSSAVKHYIEQTNDEQPISLQELSDYTGLTASHLCRIFKNDTGMSIGEYIRDNKIKRACRLLKGSDMSPAALSVLLGYTDTPHFYREFKKRVGCTPLQYRSSHSTA